MQIRIVDLTDRAVRSPSNTIRFGDIMDFTVALSVRRRAEQNDTAFDDVSAAI